VGLVRRLHLGTAVPHLRLAACVAPPGCASPSPTSDAPGAQRRRCRPCALCVGRDRWPSLRPIRPGRLRGESLLPGGVLLVRARVQRAVDTVCLSRAGAATGLDIHRIRDRRVDLRRLSTTAAVDTQRVPWSEGRADRLPPKTVLEILSREL